MKRAFIDKLRLRNKSLVYVDMELAKKLAEYVGVNLWIMVGDDEDICAAQKGDSLEFVVGAKVRLVETGDSESSALQESSGDNELLRMEVKFRMTLEVLDEIESDEPLSKTYVHELLSLVYDDIRIFMDESINKSDFRGFALPMDFRDILERVAK